MQKAEPKENRFVYSQSTVSLQCFQRLDIATGQGNPRRCFHETGAVVHSHYFPGRMYNDQMRT